MICSSDPLDNMDKGKLAGSVSYLILFFYTAAILKHKIKVPFMQRYAVL